jgi:hypothetical protein
MKNKANFITLKNLVTMTSIRRFSVLPALVLILTTMFSFTVKESNNSLLYRTNNLSIAVDGTSSLHDWTVKSEKGQCDMNLVLTGDKLTGITSLNFSVPVETLKSGHGAMDNNTFKALKSKNYKNITFSLTSGTVTPVDAVTYKVKAVGKLSIAGTTKETEILGTVKYNAADQSFTLTGVKKMNMTDYNVEPPTALFSTIKTGNAISITYNAKITK